MKSIIKSAKRGLKTTEGKIVAGLGFASGFATGAVISNIATKKAMKKKYLDEYEKDEKRKREAEEAINK